jgi:hypothetical protein
LANKCVAARRQKGAVMIEMALTFGIFMLVLLALFEFVLLMFTWSKAVEATRLGSRMAVVSDPVVSLASLDCTTTTRIEVSCATGNCGAIEQRMRGLLPQLNAGQIFVSYACTNVGFPGVPPGYQVYDVTVSIRDFRSTLAIPGVIGFPLQMDMPTFATTRTSEDLHTP